jgi:hypothetical protein
VLVAVGSAAQSLLLIEALVLLRIGADLPVHIATPEAGQPLPSRSSRYKDIHTVVYCFTGLPSPGPSI